MVRPTPFYHLKSAAGHSERRTHTRLQERPTTRAALETKEGFRVHTHDARMVLVLCIGDMHIPHRVADLPPKFRSLLVPGKIQHVLCTGDVCVKETYDYLRSLCADVHAVRGNYDGDFAAGWPDAKTVKIGDFKFGLTHGHRVVPHGDVNALAAAQRAMNVDVLVSGTCRRWGAHKVEDRLIVNPGSATGAFVSEDPDANPSFVLIDVDGSRATCYVYELCGEEVKVEKVEYSKA